MPTAIGHEALRTFACSYYQACGLTLPDAALVADTLVQADLWGHSSHGVLRLGWYGARLRSGATRATANPNAVMQAGALCVLDGENAMGQVVADRAMAMAIDAAKAHGVGAVSVRNSGHFGTAMYFTRQAARAGCIGFMSTNASPAMAPWGGRTAEVGTNPWSIAAPAGSHPPMMLDIANTAVARGKLHAAKDRGDAIPGDWALDAEGQATVDAAAGIAGSLLPMGGHKGYAIAVMMDVISGVLSGSAFGGAVTGPYNPEGTSGAGHLALAIDVAGCRPLAAFEADMDRLIAQLKAAPKARDCDEIFYPGEREARADARHRANGLTISDATWRTLEEEAAVAGIAPPDPV